MRNQRTPTIGQRMSACKNRRPVGIPKRCNTCEAIRPRSAFHRCSTTADGLRGDCKTCRRTVERERYRARVAEAGGPVYDREGMAQYRAANAERYAEYGRAYRDRYPERVRARKAVLAATRTGKLVRPSCCNRCGKDPGVDIKGRSKGRSKVRAHHYLGYEREHWLDVEWICTVCDGRDMRETDHTPRLHDPEAFGEVQPLGFRLKLARKAA